MGSILSYHEENRRYRKARVKLSWSKVSTMPFLGGWRVQQWYMYYYSCGLNQTVSALGPNKHSFQITTVHANQQRTRRPTEQKTSSQFSHCQMRYSAEGWSFSSAGVNSARLQAWHATGLSLATGHCCKNLSLGGTTRGHLVLPALHHFLNHQLKSILSDLIYQKNDSAHLFEVLVKTVTILSDMVGKIRKPLKKNKDRKLLNDEDLSQKCR